MLCFMNHAGPSSLLHPCDLKTAPRERPLKAANREVMTVNGKLYRVTWTQCHEARLRARSREEAKVIALHMDDRDTLAGVRGLCAVEVRQCGS
jgi:hypothetical protein